MGTDLVILFLQFSLAGLVFLIACGTIGWLIVLLYRPKQKDQSHSDESDHV